MVWLMQHRNIQWYHHGAQMASQSQVLDDGFHLEQTRLAPIQFEVV